MSKSTSKVDRHSFKGGEGNKKQRKVLRDLLAAQPDFACQDDVVKVAKALFNGINTPVSLALSAALERGDVDAIANASIQHENYCGVDDFYVDYCAVSFLRKWEHLGDVARSGLDPERAAIQTFYRAEALCRDTNEILSKIQSGEFSPTRRVTSILLRTKRLIKDCLKKAPRFKDLAPRFGPGATSACGGEFVTIADKLIAFPECTVDAVRIVSGLPSVSPSWFDLLARLHPNAFYNINGFTDDFGTFVYTSALCAPKLVRGNRFTTVPKTVKTHRGICIEPHSNVVFQMAVGSLLTERLASFGLPKALLQEVHRRLAREFSLTGSHATVDLSMASDTIAYKLVEMLIPPDWFNLLAELRSPETFIEGEWVELEKFSSMGNGYTFELEMLIFYALARATADELGFTTQLVSAYGDDILLPKGAISVFYEVLKFCGFVVNEEKSFVDCGFNESCGGDFLRGRDVRPYFLKESPTYATHWIALANGIRRMACKHMPDGRLDPRFVPAWLRAIARIPKPLRFHGPEGPHDLWLHTDEEHRWNVSYRGQVRRFRALFPIPRKRVIERYCSYTSYAAMLYGAASDGYSLRGEIRRLRAEWMAGLAPS